MAPDRIIIIIIYCQWSNVLAVGNVADCIPLAKCVLHRVYCAGVRREVCGVLLGQWRVGGRKASAHSGLGLDSRFPH
jgi:hypothetical protein